MPSKVMFWSPFQQQYDLTFHLCQYTSGSYTHILRLLISEFTLNENPANTNCSTLRSTYQTNNSILLGVSLLLDNDHLIVEEQVRI